MADSAGFFELASNIADFFTNSSNDDLMIRTQYATQDILIGSSNGVSTMTITSNAVAINRTIPTYTLDVGGDINFTGTLYSNGVTFTSGGGGGASGFAFNGSNLFTNCNLGIGTTTPTSKLHVVGTGFFSSDVAFSNVINVRNGIYIRLNDTNHGMIYNGTPDGPRIFGNTGGILGNAAGTNTLRWNGTGVSINTNAAPTISLDVSGNIRGSSDITAQASGASPISFNLSNSGSAALVGVTGSGSQYSSDAAGGDLTIRNTNATSIARIFLQSGSSASGLCVNSNNFIGIGTATPIYRLDVPGSNVRLNNAVIGNAGHGGQYASFSHSNVFTTTSYALLSENTGTTYVNSATGQPIHFRHNNQDQMTLISGNLGIGTTAPSQKLHVIGNILASGDITAFSDERLKSNIKIIPNALTKLHNLNGYTFDITTSTSTQDTNNSLKVTPQHTGLIAQEVLDVLPEAVHKDKDGYYSLAYGNMVGFLVQAVKEVDNKYQKIISEMHHQQQKEINELRLLVSAMQTLV